MPSTTEEAPLLRPFWLPIFGNAFRLAIPLALLAAAVRGVGMLGPQRFFWVLPVGFVMMALTPHVFFRKAGRRRAGLRLPRRSLFHHGISRIDGHLQLLPLSGALWMLLIFGTGVLFSFLRQRSGSLAAPILSHAAFNLGMNFTIFYLL